MTLADVEGQAEIQAYVQLLVWIEHTVAGFCPIHAETVGAYEHAESLSVETDHTAKRRA